MPVTRPFRPLIDAIGAFGEAPRSGAGFPALPLFLFGLLRGFPFPPPGFPLYPETDDKGRRAEHPQDKRGKGGKKYRHFGFGGVETETDVAFISQIKGNEQEKYSEDNDKSD
jgi:hypothetical protein